MTVAPHPRKASHVHEKNRGCERSEYSQQQLEFTELPLMGMESLLPPVGSPEQDCLLRKPGFFHRERHGKDRTADRSKGEITVLNRLSAYGVNSGRAQSINRRNRHVLRLKSGGSSNA